MICKISLGICPIGSSLSTGFQVLLSNYCDPYMSLACTIGLAFFWVFLPCFCMLILSLHVIELGSKSAFLNPGFCVHRLSSTIRFVGSLISFLGFLFLPAWLFWASGINKCGWCFARGRGCWLKGLHQIPSVSWLLRHSYTSHLLDCLICTRNAMSIVLLL